LAEIIRERVAEQCRKLEHGLAQIPAGTGGLSGQ
jgi:hypothetical protein